MATVLRLIRHSGGTPHPIYCRIHSSCIPLAHHVHTAAEGPPPAEPLAPPPQRTSPKMMPFEDYIQLKKKLSTRSWVAAVPFAGIGLVSASMTAGALLPANIMHAKPEEIPLILGLDPLVFSGLCCSSIMVLSFFAGASCYTRVWRMLNRSLATQMDERASDYLQRLVRHRRAGTRQSDDYYGDKVSSLSEYRRWLRDQKKAEARDTPGLAQTPKN